MSLQSLFPLGFLHYLIGGLIIGGGVALLFVTTGLVGGMSTLYSAAWSFVSKRPFFQRRELVSSRGWRVVYAIGLVVGAAIWLATSGAPPVHTSVTWWQLLAGGAIAGFGARMSNGCTSGHGICGLASLQLPSLLAVMTFLTTAIAVAHLVRFLGGA